MSSLGIKIIALLSMIADHTNKGLSLNDPVLAVFGRLAFPLFCFLSSVGFKKTRNKTNYLIRLFVCGIVSEIPFDLLWYGKVFDFSGQNVCFTLFLGGLSCVTYEHFARTGKDVYKGIGIIFALTPMISASLLNTDYGLFGAGLLFLMYLFAENMLAKALSIVAFDFTLCSALGSSDFISYLTCNQHFSLLSIPFVLTASGKKGGKSFRGFFSRYYFYMFYPTHMVILYALKLL